MGPSWKYVPCSATSGSTCTCRRHSGAREGSLERDSRSRFRAFSLDLGLGLTHGRHAGSSSNRRLRLCRTLDGPPTPEEAGCGSTRQPKRRAPRSRFTLPASLRPAHQFSHRGMRPASAPYAAPAAPAAEPSAPAAALRAVMTHPPTGLSISTRSCTAASAPTSKPAALSCSRKCASAWA